MGADRGSEEKTGFISRRSGVARDFFPFRGIPADEGRARYRSIGHSAGGCAMKMWPRTRPGLLYCIGNSGIQINKESEEDLGRIRIGRKCR